MSPLYDLAVVGSGIFGAATARDAALRDLRVVLFEKGDVASATSSASSKLVHGGIRYLEHLQLHLVRESLAEQEILLRAAPHLVTRQPFLIPDEAGKGRAGWYVALGLRLYDFLARRPAVYRSRQLPRDLIGQLEPALAGLDLRGAGLYFDAQVDDARHTLETLLDAHALGAEIHVGTEVTGLRRTGGEWRVAVRAGESEATIAARCVVNTAGPWADAVRQLGVPAATPILTLSRGAHLVVPKITERHALLLTARADKRVFFVVPHGESSLVGTTERAHEGTLDHLQPNDAELRYLWHELHARWPERFDDPRRVRGLLAGVRPLARTQRALGAASREERLVDDDGLLSVAGGKYTTHRAIAERIVNRVERRLGRTPGPGATRERPLPGGGWGDRTAAQESATGAVRAARQEGQAVDWSESEVARLSARYGSRFPELLPYLAAGATGRVRVGAETIVEAEVALAVQVEWALHLEDVLFRRLGLWTDRAAVHLALEPVAEWMAKALAWSSGRRAAEVSALEARLRRQEQALQQLAEEVGERS